MRVKIGDTWHDSKNEPICLDVSPLELSQIASMDQSKDSELKYASFPDGWGSTEQMYAWMETKKA